MIICTPDIFFHPISVMDFKKYFRSSSVLWGFFLYGSREQRRVLEQLRIGRQFASVRIFQNAYYGSAIELSPGIFRAESCCAGLVSLSG